MKGNARKVGRVPIHWQSNLKDSARHLSNADDDLDYRPSSASDLAGLIAFWRPLHEGFCPHAFRHGHRLRVRVIRHTIVPPVVVSSHSAVAKWPNQRPAHR